MNHSDVKSLVNYPDVSQTVIAYKVTIDYHDVKLSVKDWVYRKKSSERLQGNDESQRCKIACELSRFIAQIANVYKVTIDYHDVKLSVND